jgi:uncharacterized protein (TIGR03118 family)
MKTSFRKTVTGLSLACVCLLILNLGCQKNGETPKSLKNFEQVNLVGDNDQYSPAFTNANLINGWGIAFPTSGPAWVSAEGTGKTLVLNGDGTPVAISPVTIPGAESSTTSHPTGQLFNSSTDFKLPNGNPARFIFASDDGSISGWNGGADAVKIIDDSLDAGYFGIAMAADGGNNFLYAANFTEGKISVYDASWAEVDKPFVDPDLPSDYSPFNIQTIGDKLYVMYAKVGSDGDEIHHPGFGIVDVFNPDGSFVKRFASFGQLNAPWGIAMATPEFWGMDNAGQNVILIGNFGDGRINAYDENGDFLGQLRKNGNPIVIDGLWGIAFAPTTSTVIDQNKLYFAAGPGDEMHGLFGYIQKSDK